MDTIVPSRASAAPATKNPAPRRATSVPCATSRSYASTTVKVLMPCALASDRIDGMRMPACSVWRCKARSTSRTIWSTRASGWARFREKARGWTMVFWLLPIQFEQLTDTEYTFSR